MRLGLIAVKDVGLYAILTRLGIVVSTSQVRGPTARGAAALIIDLAFAAGAARGISQ